MPRQRTLTGRRERETKWARTVSLYDGFSSNNVNQKSVSQNFSFCYNQFRGNNLFLVDSRFWISKPENDCEIKVLYKLIKWFLYKYHKLVGDARGTSVLGPYENYCKLIISLLRGGHSIDSNNVPVPLRFHIDNSIKLPFVEKFMKPAIYKRIHCIICSIFDELLKLNISWLTTTSFRLGLQAVYHSSSLVYHNKFLNKLISNGILPENIVENGQIININAKWSTSEMTMLIDCALSNIVKIMKQRKSLIKRNIYIRLKEVAATPSKSENFDFKSLPSLENRKITFKNPEFPEEPGDYEFCRSSRLIACDASRLNMKDLKIFQTNPTDEIDILKEIWPPNFEFAYYRLLTSLKAFKPSLSANKIHSENDKFLFELFPDKNLENLLERYHIQLDKDTI